jgi:pentapeptide MXKDX repeat protein
MKKLFAVLMLSTFALGAFAAAETPVMKQDTTKKHKMKKDTSMKRDTSKKPPKK